MSEKETPQGELVIRTIAMPKDTNANGDIFGGWLMSQMDLGASILAKQTCRGRSATVAVEAMSFITPVKVGDTVCCYAEMKKVGRTSMNISLQVWAISMDQESHRKVTDGTFIFVAIDDSGKPRPIDQH